jgi:hypothetical protein
MKALLIGSVIVALSAVSMIGYAADSADSDGVTTPQSDMVANWPTVLYNLELQNACHLISPTEMGFAVAFALNTAFDISPAEMMAGDRTKYPPSAYIAGKLAIAEADADAVKPGDTCQTAALNTPATVTAAQNGYEQWVEAGKPQ